MKQYVLYSIHILLLTHASCAGDLTSVFALTMSNTSIDYFYASNYLKDRTIFAAGERVCVRGAHLVSWLAGVEKNMTKRV